MALSRADMKRSSHEARMARFRLLLPIFLACLATAHSPAMAEEIRPEPAFTDDSANRQDAQCFALNSFLLGIDYGTDEEQQGFTLAVAYYFGRIKARSPSVDMSALTRSILPDIASDAGSIGKRCGREMLEVGAEMVELGDTLQEMDAIVADPDYF